MKKKLVKIIKKSSRNKLKEPKKNPKLEVRLNDLLNQDVVLNINSNVFAVYGQIHGILKKWKIAGYYLFQFNPLNQWKYKEQQKQKQEKVQPISRTNKQPEYLNIPNEFDILQSIENQFDHDTPTYEFKFNISDIVSLQQNHIFLYSQTKFDPKPIKLEKYLQ